MRAAWYERQGPAHEVLQIGEMPDPEPGPGELRVRLAASGVNPSDHHRRGGRRFPMEHPRVVPNSDGAGIVDMVGAGVSDRWLGRRVWLYNGQRLGRWCGTAAEYIALSEKLVMPLPDDVGFAAGACLGIPAMTAHRAVFGDGPVEGLSVLVTGGAGAVGNYAVQLAKWGGARVAATVSGPEKARAAERAGADLVVNYRSEDVAARLLDWTGGEGVDRIVEVDFGGNLPVTERVLRNNGSMAAYASEGDDHPAIPFYRLMWKNLRLLLVTLNNMPLAAREAAQRDVGRWLATARHPPFHNVAAVLPLERIADAHEMMEGGKLGMVVVQPGSLSAAD